MLLEPYLYISYISLEKKKSESYIISKNATVSTWLDGPSCLILKNLKGEHEVVHILEKHIIMAYKEVPCISAIFSTIHDDKGKWLIS